MKKRVEVRSIIREHSPTDCHLFGLDSGIYWVLWFPQPLACLAKPQYGRKRKGKQNLQKNVKAWVDIGNCSISLPDLTGHSITALEICEKSRLLLLCFFDILTHSHSRVHLEILSATFILLEITWE